MSPMFATDGSRERSNLSMRANGRARMLKKSSRGSSDLAS